ncbi:aminodeoxychorismate synthase component I [Shewanella sp. NFH-SH190041]|uniref:aminodeoxychorismate synthase component I n=1 Tax=Shewanella sp. NFH-SH190041 TaxID=2950245 RepID=UPI0021C31C01|nr:aminodeoxychorismate synthase component I [Shewanella sp. NFH-SH190041]
MNSKASYTPASCRLAWPLSTEAVFHCFAATPWSILLDSANADHPDARFDIICAEPIATLTHQHGCNILNYCQPTNDPATATIKHRATLPADPFCAIEQVMQQLYPNPTTSSLPFSGGAMGAWGYDLGRAIESLPTTAVADLTLPDLNLGFYDWALIFDNKENAWQLVHARGEQALKSQRCKLEQQLAHLLSKTDSTSQATDSHKRNNKPTEIPAETESNDFRLNGPWQPQLTQAQYTAKFDTIQAYLHSGDCYQINLTQRFTAPYHGDEWQAYCQLRNSNKAPFSAFMRLPQQSILSISPERFIRLADGEIETKPIKGTLPRYSDLQLDQQAAQRLANSEKDQAENLMIVDLLRNDLGKVATPGSVRVPKLFAIESFPAVHHLVSTVTATLRPDCHATDLLRGAFPGGSITGAPKIRAMEIIEELEPSRRNLYCGTMGYISQDGKMDTSITIRTLVAEQGQLFCWAGGGIVADSTAEAEYQETFDKISRILPVLG